VSSVLQNKLIVFLKCLVWGVVVGVEMDGVTSTSKGEVVGVERDGVTSRGEAVGEENVGEAVTQ